MKRIIILSAFITILGVWGTSHGQSTGTFSLTFNGQTTGGQTATYTFTGLANPNIKLSEVVLPMTADAVCSEAADISTAEPISPDRAVAVFDPSTGKYIVRWTTPVDQVDTCRVLLGDGDSDGRDFLIWQRNLGSTGQLDADEATKKGTGGADATIRVHYNTGYGNRMTLRSSASPR